MHARHKWSEFEKKGDFWRNFVKSILQEDIHWINRLSYFAKSTRTLIFWVFHVYISLTSESPTDLDSHDFGVWAILSDIWFPGLDNVLRFHQKTAKIGFHFFPNQPRTLIFWVFHVYISLNSESPSHFEVRLYSLSLICCIVLKIIWM